MASTSLYSPKNATGPMGMGGQEPLSMEQVIQGVMNPTANALNTTLLDSSGNPITTANPLPTSATVAPPTPGPSTKATVVRGTKAPAATNTPEALAAAGTYVSQVVICGQRAARVANTSSVWIDGVAGNGLQLIELTPGAAASPGINGSSYTLTAPPGKVIDLGDIYVQSITLTDGVSWLGFL